jgi:hypothetical protein
MNIANLTYPLTSHKRNVEGADTSNRAMVYTACAVFLYGGTSDQPLPPVTARWEEQGHWSLLRVCASLGSTVRGVTLEAGADDVERVEGRDGGEPGGRSSRGVLPRARLRQRRRVPWRHLRREVVVPLALGTQEQQRAAVRSFRKSMSPDRSVRGQRSKATASIFLFPSSLWAAWMRLIIGKILGWHWIGPKRQGLTVKAPLEPRKSTRFLKDFISQKKISTLLFATQD